MPAVRSANARIAVTDAAGKVVRSLSADMPVMTTDISGLAPGIYFVRYADDNLVQTIKISKQ